MKISQFSIQHFFLCIRVGKSRRYIMGNKLFRTLVLVLCLSLLFVTLIACGKMKDSNMNNSELLAIDNIIRLLDDNGAVLNKVNDFPVDLSLCTVSGKAPQPYINSESGVYYMFYEYDTGIVKQVIWLKKDFLSNTLIAIHHFRIILYPGVLRERIFTFANGSLY